MRYLALSLVLCSAVSMLGCGSPAPVEETTGPRPLRLGDSIEVSLEGLLTKPRPELAELADQWLTKIEYQERALKEGRLQYYLLPKLRFPLVVPVWQNAKYSAQLGFSVPSYASDHKDSALAFHLAHYGDSAAAKKFAEPADVVAISQVQASAACLNRLRQDEFVPAAPVRPQRPAWRSAVLFPHPSTCQAHANHQSEVPRGFRTVHPIGWTLWKGK